MNNGEGISPEDKYRQQNVDNVEQKSASRSHFILERLSPDNPVFLRAKQLEFEVFQSTGFLEEGDEAAQELLGYSKYEEASIFNAVMNRDGDIVGALREIRSSKAGFKTLEDFRLYDEAKDLISTVPSEKILEIGTLAVKPGERKAFGIAQRLYGMSLYNSLRNGYEYWIASIDSGLLQIYRDQFKFQFIDIGEPKEYIGSSTTPVIMKLDEGVEYLRENNIGQYRQIVLGEYGDEKVEY
jgi:hypothetical protein